MTKKQKRDSILILSYKKYTNIKKENMSRKPKEPKEPEHVPTSNSDKSLEGCDKLPSRVMLDIVKLAIKKLPDLPIPPPVAETENIPEVSDLLAKTEGILALVEGALTETSQLDLAFDLAEGLTNEARGISDEEWEKIKQRLAPYIAIANNIPLLFDLLGKINWTLENYAEASNKLSKQDELPRVSIKKFNEVRPIGYNLYYETETDVSVTEFWFTDANNNSIVLRQTSGLHNDTVEGMPDFYFVTPSNNKSGIIKYNHYNPDLYKEAIKLLGLDKTLGLDGIWQQRERRIIEVNIARLERLWNNVAEQPIEN